VRDGRVDSRTFRERLSRPFQVEDGLSPVMLKCVAGLWKRVARLAGESHRIGGRTLEGNKAHGRIGCRRAGNGSRCHGLVSGERP